MFVEYVLKSPIIIKQATWVKKVSLAIQKGVLLFFYVKHNWDIILDIIHVNSGTV